MLVQSQTYVWQFTSAKFVICEIHKWGRNLTLVLNQSTKCSEYSHWTACQHCTKDSSCCLHLYPFFLSALSINSNTSISTKLPVTASFMEIVTTSNVTKLFCFHLGWHFLIWSQAALLHEVCWWVFVYTVIMDSTEAENCLIFWIAVGCSEDHVLWRQERFVELLTYYI